MACKVLLRFWLSKKSYLSEEIIIYKIIQPIWYYHNGPLAQSPVYYFEWKTQLNHGFFIFSGSLADRVSKMSDETLHQMVGFLGPDQSFPLMQEYNKRWKKISQTDFYESNK